MRDCELRVAQQQVVVGDCRRTAARARQRVGKQRNPRPGRELGKLRGSGRIALVASGDDHDATERMPGARLRGLAWTIEADVRMSSVTAGLVIGERPIENERLAKREVEMHRTGPARGCRPVGAAGERPDPPQPLGGGVVDANLEEPFDGVTVELDLVDRLTGADLAQLRGAVRRQHDQRHARVPGLDHCRSEIRRGGSRRARDRDRTF